MFLSAIRENLTSIFSTSIYLTGPCLAYGYWEGGRRVHRRGGIFCLRPCFITEETKFFLVKKIDEGPKLDVGTDEKYYGKKIQVRLQRVKAFHFKLGKANMNQI